MKVIPYPHFELDMGMTTWGRNKENSENKLPSFSQNINYKIQNPHQLKTYACLNKRIRSHRVWFYYYLFNSGLLNDGLVSMNEFDKHWYNWEGKFFEDGQLDECSSILPLLVYETPNNVLDDNIKANLYLTLIRGDVPIHYGDKTAPNKKYVIIRETLDNIANTYINAWNAEAVEFLADPVHVQHTLRNYDLEFRKLLRNLKIDDTDIGSPVLDLIPLRDEFLKIDYDKSETRGTIVYNYGLKGETATVIFGETSLQFAGEFTKTYSRTPRAPE
jgi:hypothetical protein